LIKNGTLGDFLCMNILIIGGTRNIGYFLAQELLSIGHRVTVLNRGLTRDDLPEEIARLRCDRDDAAQLRRALLGRTFDVVIDNVLYNGHQAQAVVDLLAGRVGHYIFLSTGQVYLVREDLERPFHEDNYEGRLVPAPKEHTYGYEEWLYGIEKRQAEEVMIEAAAMRQFPYTSLRLPMVNGERDHFNRLYNYYLRLKDGGPILVPETPNYALRHVYSGDVVSAIVTLIETGKGKGRAYNISQDETVSLEEFLGVVADVIGATPQIVRMKWSLLHANGFLPDCSPFSDRWMSELDNTRSKAELGIHYTPLPTYLKRIVAYYENTPPPKPTSYGRRHAEKHLALQSEG
jgi:nucleoside-diphosphate-sugar epimerase